MLLANAELDAGLSRPSGGVPNSRSTSRLQGKAMNANARTGPTHRAKANALATKATIAIRSLRRNCRRGRFFTAGPPSSVTFEPVYSNMSEGALEMPPWIRIMRLFPGN